MVDTSCGSWMRVGMDAWALGLDASAVIALRVAKIASGGDPAGEEARLMVSEKLLSIGELPVGMLGLTPLAGTRKALRYYERKVSANRRRLSAG